MAKHRRIPDDEPTDWLRLVQALWPIARDLIELARSLWP